MFAAMKHALRITEKTGHKKTGRQAPGFGNGGAKRDRTVDLYAASVALSQLSYGPVGLESGCFIRSEGGAFRHSLRSLST